MFDKDIEDMNYEIPNRNELFLFKKSPNALKNPKFYWKIADKSVTAIGMADFQEIMKNKVFDFVFNSVCSNDYR